MAAGVAGVTVGAAGLAVSCMGVALTVAGVTILVSLHRYRCSVAVTVAGAVVRCILPVIVSGISLVITT